MKLEIAKATFRRSSPIAFGKLAPIPAGWIVVRSSFVSTKILRRKTHGRWVRLRSAEGTIYRILRFSPNLKREKIVVDWIGWIDLQGRIDEESETLELTIDLARWWHFFVIPFVHPEPAYRLSSIIAVALGVPSVMLGIASIWLTLASLAKADSSATAMQFEQAKTGAVKAIGIGPPKIETTERAPPNNQTPPAAARE